MSNEQQPCQVPLIERLRSVPEFAHEMIEINPTHHRNIPYGQMCHEAADALRIAEVRISQLTSALRITTEFLDKDVYREQQSGHESAPEPADQLSVFAAGHIAANKKLLS